MTFPAAAGYNNLPQGNFTPEIYSKKAQIAFRKTAVIQAITNTDYAGEIAEYGDTVRIIKEPNITVSSYVRGQTVRTQDLDDDEIVLVVDKANSYAFRVDDIEDRQSHINWEGLASDHAGYRLADQMDIEVLNYMTTQVGDADGGEVDLSSHLLGSTSDPIEIVTDGSGDNVASFSPLNILNRFMRILDEQNVPTEGRWFVADPVFYEKLGDEDSKLLSDDYANKGILRNGMISQGMVRGFQLYKSNNLPRVGSGPAGTAAGDYGWLLAGHMSSTATAEQLLEAEQFRDPDTFADVVRGLHVYGRKVLRPESLVGSIYHSAA